MKSILMWLFGCLCAVSISQCSVVQQEGSKLSLLNLMKMLQNKETEHEDKRGGPLSNFNRHRQRKGKRDGWETFQTDEPGQLVPTQESYEMGEEELELAEQVLGEYIDSAKKGSNSGDYDLAGDFNFNIFKSYPRKKEVDYIVHKRESEGNDEDFDFDIFKSDPRKKGGVAHVFPKPRPKMQEVNVNYLREIMPRNLEEEIAELLAVRRLRELGQSIREEYKSNEMTNDFHDEFFKYGSSQQDGGNYEILKQEPGKNNISNSGKLEELKSVNLLEKVMKIQQMMTHQEERKDKRGHPLVRFSQHRQARNKAKKAHWSGDQPETRFGLDQSEEYEKEGTVDKFFDEILEKNSQKRTDGEGSDDFDFDIFKSDPRRRWEHVYKQVPRSESASSAI